MAAARKGRGALVRQARLEDKGWTKEELSRAAGVSAQTVRKVERGLAVSEVSIARIAKALGLSMQSLKGRA
jgi:transcriptional regulator with XRE-family HTH domain